MARYLFIQSQDPFTEVRVHAQFDLARRLVAAGNQVRLLLVQNGVSAARRGARCESFDALSGHGVGLLADEFALQQREIDGAQLKNAVAVAGVDLVIDAMLAGDKVIWN